MSWPLASSGQSTGVSASASVLPVNSQGLFPLGWTGLISLLSKGLSRVLESSKASILSKAPQFKSISSSALSLLYGPVLTFMHDYGKTIALTMGTLYKIVKQLPLGPKGCGSIPEDGKD